ncbi:hypothetical protein ABGT92_23565 [Streptomyces cinereoruber]|uniref:hypothetical protein n=1 Tax=Streptomyces cinereoruber TaxID=67260 RepID=UPI00345D1C06
MIALDLTPVPMPGSVTYLIGDQTPQHVLTAMTDAATCAYTASICRAPQYREARERALADLAAANKVLAAYNPAFVVRGAR